MTPAEAPDVSTPEALKPQGEVALEVTPPAEAAVEAEAPPEGEAEAEEKPWWHSVDSEDGLIGHERLQSHLEEVKEQGRRKAQADLQPLVQARRDFDRQRAERSQLISDALQDFGTRAGRLMREGNPDYETWAALFQDLRPQLRMLFGENVLTGRLEGANWLLEQIAKDSGVRSEFYDRIHGAAARPDIGDPTLGADLLDRLGVGDVKGLRMEAERLKSTNQRLETQVKELKAQLREGEGSERPPSSAAGGKSYSDMTYEERSKLTPEQRDALVRRELGG